MVQPMQAPNAMDPERWVDEHGDYLFHYALSRLRDPSKAEDMVQEALLAALRGRDRFEGRSAERSWLTGILKNKILDHFRTAGRETNFTDVEFYGDEDAASFDPSKADHWTDSAAPSEWDAPGADLDKAEFWKVFRGCTSKLPDRVARVFLLREVDGVGSEEICENLRISPNNLWVMLHRARLALRRCLEENWFRTGA
jgi:RNA polymerase sigma-70 factor, ECF subfamily